MSYSKPYNLFSSEGMRHERLVLYQQLEQQRGSRLLVYVTGDRPRFAALIAPDVLPLFVEHLDRIGHARKISLYLYTRGGHTLAAWSLVNLIRQFCDEFEVIVPDVAHSAGTLICLGADTVVMTKQATLGPIDPIGGALVSIEGQEQNQMSVSVEAINGFIELARQELGIEGSENMTSILKILSDHVNPVTLGHVFRTRTQIRMLGDRLLSRHLKDQEKRERILNFLCSESGSHDYTISRQEARDGLGLKVDRPDDALYQTIKFIYNSITDELELGQPFQPAILLGQDQASPFRVRRALIESLEGGGHYFDSEGLIQRQAITGPQGVQQVVIQINPVREGWHHEPVRPA